MGIEPLGSAMTYTAQGTRTAAVSQTPAETMEGQPVETNASKIDDQTISVAKLQQNSSENENNSSAQEDTASMNEDMIRKAMQELNKKATSVESEFGIHEKTNRIIIKIVDKKTKEVIKELPPEKMLDMIARVWEYAGLVVDEKR